MRGADGVMISICFGSRIRQNVSKVVSGSVQQNALTAWHSNVFHMSCYWRLADTWDLRPNHLAEGLVHLPGWLGRANMLPSLIAKLALCCKVRSSLGCLAGLT